jgi:hypothetical protein
MNLFIVLYVACALIHCVVMGFDMHRAIARGEVIVEGANASQLQTILPVAVIITGVVWPLFAAIFLSARLIDWMQYRMEAK